MDAPAIKANYLTDGEDWRCAKAGVRLAQTLAETPSMHDYTASCYRPERRLESDSEVKEFCSEYGTTIFHPVGTCKMGSDDRSVVDPRLRVHGLANLRIADASIMPTLVSGNTSAAATMIGEKAAEYILEGANAF